MGSVSGVSDGGGACAPSEPLLWATEDSGHWHQTGEANVACRENLNEILDGYAIQQGDDKQRRVDCHWAVGEDRQREDICRGLLLPTRDEEVIELVTAESGVEFHPARSQSSDASKLPAKLVLIIDHRLSFAHLRHRGSLGSIRHFLRENVNGTGGDCESKFWLRFIPRSDLIFQN